MRLNEEVNDVLARKMRMGAVVQEEGSGRSDLAHNSIPSSSDHRQGNKTIKMKFSLVTLAAVIGSAAAARPQLSVSLAENIPDIATHFFGGSGSPRLLLSEI